LQERSDNTQPLLYEIIGPAVLKERIPLYEVVGTLREYMNIVDRSYLTLTGKDRLSKKEREKYKIIAYKFDPGSLHIDLAIELYELVQQVFPFMMPAGATGLWNLTKSTYNFVKTVTELRARGDDPVIQEDNRIQSYIVGDNNKIMVNPSISINADKIEESISKIGGFISPGAVDQVALKDPEEDGISITEEEKSLFNPETTISEDTETIAAKIYRLDVESKKGKLYILEGAEPKDIPFQIIGDQAIGPYIDALKTDQIKVNILREMAVSLTGKPYLKRVLLVGFPGSKPNQSELF
jgi:hypothetical protein